MRPMLGTVPTSPWCPTYLTGLGTQTPVGWPQEPAQSKHHGGISPLCPLHKKSNPPTAPVRFVVGTPRAPAKRGGAVAPGPLAVPSIPPGCVYDS